MKDLVDRVFSAGSSKEFSEGACPLQTEAEQIETSHASGDRAEAPGRSVLAFAGSA